MVWKILFHPKFKLEFDRLPLAVQNELLAKLAPLARFGPAMGRPEVGTLAGSKYANLKELRFHAANGVWRVAFAFDPKRSAVILIAGDKAGVSEAAFYRTLIKKAEARLNEHLETLKK